MLDSIDGNRAKRIAKALAASKPAGFGKERLQWEFDVKIIADALQEWGQEFNRPLFYQDCGYDPDPIGTALKWK